jgi:hypothetical protein
MSNNEHTITPPPELVQKWAQMTAKNDIVLGNWVYIATQAARWGADQELEACCEFMQHEDFHGFARELRATRRPQPSLAKRALHILGTHGDLSPEEHSKLSRFLEEFPE